MKTYKNSSIFPGEIRLLKLERQGKTFFVAMITDISARKKAEIEQHRLIEELQNALKNIQTLKGLIPICGICRKIRNDSGYWNNLDIFLQANSDVRFSHELCPDCKKKNRFLIFSYFNQFIGPMVVFHIPDGPLDENTEGMLFSGAIQAITTLLTEIIGQGENQRVKEIVLNDASLLIAHTPNYNQFVILMVQKSTMFVQNVLDQYIMRLGNITEGLPNDEYIEGERKDQVETLIAQYFGVNNQK